MSDTPPLDVKRKLKQKATLPERKRWHVLIDVISTFIHDDLKTYIFKKFENYYQQKSSQIQPCTHKNDCSKKTLMSKDWCPDCLNGNEEKCGIRSKCQQNSMISESDWCKECREKAGQDCTNRQKVPCAKKRELKLCKNCLNEDSPCLNIKLGCSKYGKSNWCKSCEAWKREITTLLRETCNKKLYWGSCDTSLFSNQQDTFLDKTVCINELIKTFIPDKYIGDHPLNDLGNCLLVIEMCNLFPEELGTFAPSFKQRCRNSMHHGDESLSEDEDAVVLEEVEFFYECMKTNGIHNNNSKYLVQQIKEYSTNVQPIHKTKLILENIVCQLQKLILESPEHEETTSKKLSITDKANNYIHFSECIQATENTAVQETTDDAAKDHERDSLHQITDTWEVPLVVPSNTSSTNKGTHDMQKQFDDMKKEFLEEFKRIKIQEEQLRAELKIVKDASKQQIHEFEDRISELQSQLKVKEKALAVRDEQIDAVLKENKMLLEENHELIQNLFHQLNMKKDYRCSYL